MTLSPSSLSTDGRDEPTHGPMASETFAPAGTKRAVAAALIGQADPGSETDQSRLELQGLELLELLEECAR